MKRKRIEVSEEEFRKLKEKLGLQVFEGKKYLKIKVGNVEYVCRKG